MSDNNDINLDHVWLPYTQHLGAKMPPLAVDASGCKIILEDRKELIDGMASWWTACHGYKHPHLLEALQKQAQDLPHMMFGSFANKPAFDLAARLAKITGLPKIFYSDSGSTAIEVAMKISVQYWRNQNKFTQKSKFLHFANSYHGDTMGAMSIGDSAFSFNQFSGHVPMQFKIDIPLDEMAFEDFEQVLAEHHKQLAGVVIEPLVQCAGGMKFHSPDVLAEIHRICKKFDLVFIADEIAVGFGRTGYMFGCQEAGIVPDIMCVGKALTGGVMTLAASCCAEWLFEGFLSEEKAKTFMHGPTYMGNAMACAVAGASLDLFESEPRLTQVAKVEEILLRELEKCKALKCVEDVRVKGAIGVVELTEGYDTFPLRDKFLEHGVFIRPFSNIVYLAPSFVISQDELVKLCDAIFTVLD